MPESRPDLPRVGTVVNMKIIPFLTVTLKIPVRTAFGTVRIGIGFFVRLSRRQWFCILFALGMLLAATALLSALLPWLVS
ncbi:MAG: hypothetical protein OXC63_03440 [Aestuariivita sp.]|nr:hypothetical protein [Aestuariivita sp.]MCY4346427.1 hypothetical protein [Aestuariivita sp.]